MFRSMKELFGYAVVATDGTIGKVEDFLFDQGTHELRYLVVDTGGWLDRHHVLVAVNAFGRPRWPALDFPVKLTCEQVRRSPDLVPDATLTREGEARLHSYYEWMPYWLTHAHGAPTAHIAGERPALYRAHELLGLSVAPGDVEVGHVLDFIIDIDHWRLTSVVIDTGLWWPPRAVMVPVGTLIGVDTAAGRALFSLTEKQILDSPVFEASAIACGEHELVLYDYLGRPRL